MSIPPPLRATITIAIFLAGLVAVGWFAKQSCWFAERHHPASGDHVIDSNNTIDLDGTLYTVTNVFHTDRIGLTRAGGDTSYLIVSLKALNPRPTVATHNTRFRLLSLTGSAYRVNEGLTVWDKNDKTWYGVPKAWFGIEPEALKDNTLVFTVPTGILSQPLTLDIEDGSSSGMIRIGPAGGTLARD